MFEPDPWWLPKLFSLYHTRWQLHQPFHSQPSGPDALLFWLGLPEVAHGSATCLHPSGPHCDWPKPRFCLDLLAATFKGKALSEVQLHDIQSKLFSTSRRAAWNGLKTLAYVQGMKNYCVEYICSYLKPNVETKRETVILMQCIIWKLLAVNEQYCHKGVVWVDDQILSILKTACRNADAVQHKPKVLAFDMKNITK